MRSSVNIYPALSGITLFEVSNSASPIVGTAPCGCPSGVLGIPKGTTTGGCPYNRLITKQSFARNNAILPDAEYKTLSRIGVYVNRLFLRLAGSH